MRFKVPDSPRRGPFLTLLAFASVTGAPIALAGLVTGCSLSPSQDTIVHSVETSGHVVLTASSPTAAVTVKAQSHSPPNLLLQTRARWSGAPPGSRVQLLVDEGSCVNKCSMDLDPAIVVVTTKAVDHLDPCTSAPCTFPLAFKLLGSMPPGVVYVDWTFQSSLEEDLNRQAGDAGISVTTVP